MTFPAVIGADNSVETADVTTHNVDKPAGAASGDRVVVLFAIDGGTGVAITGTGGLTLVGRQDKGTTIALIVYYRNLDGSEGATFDVISNLVNESAHEVLLYDAGTFDPATAPEAAFANSLSANPDPPSLTPSWGAADTGWIAGYAADTGDRTATGYPTNYASNQHTVGSVGAAGASVAIATRDLNATSDDPGTFTMTSDDWAACTVAIRPASAAPKSLIVPNSIQHLLVR